MAEKRPKLIVEGKDDRHTVIHFLIRNGFPYSKGALSLSPSYLPEVIEAEGVENLIVSIETRIMTSAAQIVGFVLDADASAADRWKEVRHKLEAVRVADLPIQVPSNGFIGRSEQYRTIVGVWIMPNNQDPGAIEDFLKTLIPEADALLDHAIHSTQDARAKGARFPDAQLEKATLHTWLAWQEEPGLTYGLAMRARYFQHDRSQGASFVNWVRSLYKIQDLSSQTTSAETG